MLKNIKVRNFCSIGDEQEMSLEITKKDIQNDSVAQINEMALNLVSCVVGPNASGKTTILKVLSFLSWFTNKSYANMKPEKEIPIEAHKLKSRKTTLIEIEFFENKELYKYSLELTNKKVVKERLSKKMKRMTRIFELTRTQGDIKIATHSSLKISKNDAERIKNRQNISLLSSLLDLGYLKDMLFFKNLEVLNVSMGGNIKNRHIADLINTSQNLFENKSLRQGVLLFSKDIDLGISDFLFKGAPWDEKINLMECRHTSKAGNFDLTLFEESNGTQRSFSILSEVLPILETGGVVVLDEIEDGLHPYVVKKIISLFENRETNPKGAQLIFSTHQHLLLEDRTKTQIFITEKSDKTLESEIYRLDDIEGVRNDENYFHKYLAGTYGGTPNIPWL